MVRLLMKSRLHFRQSLAMPVTGADTLITRPASANGLTRRRTTGPSTSCSTRHLGTRTLSKVSAPLGRPLLPMNSTCDVTLKPGSVDSTNGKTTVRLPSTSSVADSPITSKIGPLAVNSLRPVSSYASPSSVGTTFSGANRLFCPSGSLSPKAQMTPSETRWAIQSRSGPSSIAGSIIVIPTVLPMPMTCAAGVETLVSRCMMRYRVYWGTP